MHRIVRMFSYTYDMTFIKLNFRKIMCYSSDQETFCALHRSVFFSSERID